MTSLANSKAESRRLQLTGVVYLVVIALLVTLSIALYQRAFSGDVPVTVRTAQAPEQLNAGGDVRMNGQIVGRVTGVRVTPDGADVRLALHRDAADRMPADLVARVLPTTLFGQKFVALRSSATAGAPRLEADAVIPEDTTAEAVELSTVLDHLDDVLTGIKPDQLAVALGSLARSLDGRGDQLHSILAEGGTYLTGLNQDAPLLTRDIALLDQVATDYTADLPDLIAVLQQSGEGGQALVADRAVLSTFLGRTSSAADAGTKLLTAARANLERSNALARPTLSLLARFSPEFACVIDGFLGVEASSAAQIQGSTFKGLFTTGAQADGYTLSDRLVNGDIGSGPSCRGLPGPQTPYPAVVLHDGVSRSGSSTPKVGLRAIVPSQRSAR